jgi:hypothetical protein
VDVSLATLIVEAKRNVIPDMAPSVAEADEILARFGVAEEVMA